MRSLPSWLAWALYALMGAVGLAWAELGRGAPFTSPSAPWLSTDRTEALWLGLLLALAIAACTVWSSRVLVARTRWARDLMETLRLVLLGTSRRRMLLLSCLAAVAEELFFRSAMQPTVGIAVTSIAFGLIHISPAGQGMAWSLWAGGMGMVFGILFEASGHIVVPILAHALINFENMQFLCGSDPARPTQNDSPRPRTHLA